MSAKIIPFPSKPKLRTVLWDEHNLMKPIDLGWFDREMRAALKRVFGEQSSKPSDSE